MGKLVHHVDEIVRALMDDELFGESADQEWLASQYRSLAPLIVEDCLRAVETGTEVSQNTLTLIRNSAKASRHEGIEMPTVLNGSVPALRVITAFINARRGELLPQDAAILIGRSALVAVSLGSAWAAAWAEVEVNPAVITLADEAPGEPDADLVIIPGDVSRTTLEMIYLAAHGDSNDEIAEKTSYSPHAVKWHLSRAMRAWNAKNRTDLIAQAVTRGVLRIRSRAQRRPTDDTSN